MRYHKFGRTDLDLSILSHGTWQLGGDEWGPFDQKEAIGAIRKSIEMGVNLIDTAPRYGVGRSEELVGEAIQGLRSKVNIATKCGLFVWRAQDGSLKTGKDLTPKAIRREIETSLTKLHIDYIDIYIIHRPDPVTPLEESLSELERLRKEGKYRFLGVSNFDVELLKRAMKTATIDCIQSEFSLLSRQNMELIECARENEIGIMAYGALGAGILSGNVTEIPKFKGKDARDFYYPFFKETMFDKCMALVDELRVIASQREKPVSHVALNWVVQQKGITTALVGSTSQKNVVENSGVGDWNLTAEELSVIDSAYSRLFD